MNHVGLLSIWKYNPGWAFDSTPEEHAHEIAATHLGCPTDSTASLVRMMMEMVMEMVMKMVVIGVRPFSRVSFLSFAS